MNDLQELLAGRDTQGDTLVLRALRDGLAQDASRSGSAAPLHTLLLDYFALDETATSRSFMSAFRRHRATAQALVAMLEEDGEAQAAGLMRSLLEGQPRPTGALRAGLGGDAVRQAAAAGPGVQAAFEAFANTALANEQSSAEIEMSLAWAAVEGSLLDRVAGAADVLAFAHGPEHRARRDRLAQLDALVARSSIGEMLGAIAAAPRPRVLAQPSEYAVEHEGAPGHTVEIPVRHEWGPHRALPASHATDSPATRALAELHAFADGAALFIPLDHVPQEPGLFLLAEAARDEEREHLTTWLTMGIDPDELPAWAHSLVPVAALNGDAARWVVPLTGPHAGSVMLSPDDVHEEQPRYPSLAHFIAALRLCPQAVLGNGGYVSYVVPEHEHLLYPVGHAEDDAPEASA